jgi:hypothetical protein
MGGQKTNEEANVKETRGLGGMKTIRAFSD